MQVFGLFAKQPIPGTVKTRLAEAVGPAAAAALSEAFLRDLTDRFGTMADRRWIGYAPSTPAAKDWFEALAAGRFRLWPQPDDSLGERIEAFFSSAFAAGATRVVLIGSDSPTLPHEFVDQAYAALERNDTVLGPAEDGGYYLIGSRKPLCDSLASVRWSTPDALEDTIDVLLRHDLAPTVLSKWFDVDTAEDLGRVLGECSAARIIHRPSPAPHTEERARNVLRP